MNCSTASRGCCHGRSFSTNAMSTAVPTSHRRSFSTNTMPASINKSLDSDDDFAGTYYAHMYQRATATATTHTTAATSRQPSSSSTIPKSTTSRSLTGFHIRDRYQNPDRHDATGRRRSANADILESLGLPSMVSFEYMKSLQDGISEDDILKPHKTRQPKSHQRSSSRRVSVCLTAYNDCFRGAASVVSDGAAQLAKRVCRCMRKVTPTSRERVDKEKARDEKEQSPDMDAPASVSTADDEHVYKKQARASGVQSQRKEKPIPQLGGGPAPLRPNMWVRHRKVSSGAAVDDKSI